jgi:eukaryotic-like serine/threonine-protein kinase
VADVRHDSEELQAGSTLGPYDLLAPIGVGGMARVWAARVRGTRDVVALKMLLPELAQNVEFRKMFFDEARIASRVRHPNVCGTFQMGEQSGVLFLAMEWLDGPSLMRILRPGREDVDACERVPIRPRVAARIVADACAGLHAAHDLLDEDGRPLGVVHRDVSPHNLLITSDGSVKVTDFGVAKALGKSHMTMAGQLKGKLAYMAPEQLVGGGVDRRCDVFALGCVLYEITTGQRPFQGEHDPQVMTAIMLGRYEPPGAIMPGYPHELSIIVMRALANDAEGRYPSAEHMRQALETYLRNSGPSVGPPQIAALIRERCGDELVLRANALRDDAAAAPGATRAASWGPDAKAKASDSGSGAMMIVDGRPAPARRGLLWMVAAALLGAALGIGVLSFVRASRKAKTALAQAEIAASASARAAQQAAAAQAPSASTATPAAATPGRVHLRITPDSAVVIIDGVVLPRGTDTVAKPAGGATVNVLVRADKHEDTIVMIDSASPEDVEVTLVPNAVGVVSTTSSGPSGGTAGVATVRPRPRVDAAASAKDPPDPPPIDAPPNPYE